MVKSEKKIHLKMLSTQDQFRRIKCQQLKKKYRYATGGSGRRFMLGFALRRLRSHGKSEIKKESTKRSAVWTVSSTSQATNSSPEDNLVEEKDVTEVESEESLKQEEDSPVNDKVEDTASDQFLLPASFTANGALTFPSESQNLLQDDRSTAALPTMQCPVEPTQFFNSLPPKGLQILKDIEAHVSTHNSSCHHPPLKDLEFDGITPLILACHYGNVDWVKHIVERWGADVNAAGAYFFDPLCRYGRGYGSKIARAIPVFVAAFNVHGNVVEYLVGKGAGVSLKASSEKCNGYYDGLTPLYGALNQRCAVPCDRMEDVTNIVRFLLKSGADPNDVPSHISPIWMGRCNMFFADATIALIHHGLDLKQQHNSYDQTVMHYWVRINAQRYMLDPHRRLDPSTVVKLLVDKGANFMAQNDDGITVIQAVIKQRSWDILDYILEKEGGDQMGKIEAMEMAAATILSKKYISDFEFERAFGYWRRALHLRLMEPDTRQKTPLVLKSGQAGEWMTSDQLEYVIKHPLEYKFQSFLVRLRICCNTSCGATYDLIRDSFDECLEDLIVQRRWVDCIDVLWLTLKLIHFFHMYSEDDLRSMIDNIIEKLLSVLWNFHVDDPLLNAETFKFPLEVMVAAFVLTDDYEDSSVSDTSCDSDTSYKSDSNRVHVRHMRLLLKIFAFLARLPREILSSDVRQSLRQLVLQCSFGYRGRTLLHMVCEDIWCGAFKLPTVLLLLQSGANPNAADKYGKVPLHLLANSYGNYAVHLSAAHLLIQSAAHLLLEYGAQLDRADNYGNTPADIWIQRHKPEAGWNDLPEWCLKPVTVPTLKTLSARVVRAQISLPTDELPVTLVALVEMRELSG